MIDLNGHDIEAVDEVKAVILEFVNVWGNYKMRIPPKISVGYYYFCLCTGQK
jgi:hypothetical protein